MDKRARSLPESTTRLRLRLCGLLLATVVMAHSAGDAFAAEAPVVGVIKTLKGQAAITRNQQIIPAAIGMKLREGDVLQTSQDSSLGLILRDDSVLSMGPNSNLIIDQFQFAPKDGKLGFQIKILRGTVDYVSGMIGKLSPGAAKFETPVATIGVRGTHFAVKV